MANRSSLHRNKLDDFKDWLYYQTDFQWQEGTGDWQLLRVYEGKKHIGDIYDNLKPEHLTVTQPLQNIVRRYLDEKNG